MANLSVRLSRSKINGKRVIVIPTPQEAHLDQEFHLGEFMAHHKVLTLCLLLSGLEFEGVPVLETVAKAATMVTYFSLQ